MSGRSFGTIINKVIYIVKKWVSKNALPNIQENAHNFTQRILFFYLNQAFHNKTVIIRKGLLPRLGRGCGFDSLTGHNI